MKNIHLLPTTKSSKLYIKDNGNPKYVAQGLLKTWKQEKKSDINTSKVAPLMHYLKFNYEERYVKLCRRLSVEPCGFGAWLQKPISSII